MHLKNITQSGIQTHILAHLRATLTTETKNRFFDTVVRSCIYTIIGKFALDCNIVQNHSLLVYISEVYDKLYDTYVLAFNTSICQSST